MPELPEVETIKLGLQKKISGLTIKQVDVRAAKTFIGNPKELIGRKIRAVWRKAKILGIDLSGGLSLLFHLKMTGQLIWIKTQNSNVKSQNHNSKLKTGRLIGGHPTPDMMGSLPNSHTRVIFTFGGGSCLYFNDQRKFGWIKLIEGKERKTKIKELLGSLGPEPLDKNFSWQMLKSNLLKHKSQPIKVALMDQSVVAGVGNIYANEACFLAKIDPRTKVVNLTDIKFQALHRGVIGALREGIKHGGSTIAHFVDSEGRKGYFLDYAYVYGLDNHPCKRCGLTIKKFSLGGRGTYFCPACQR